MTEGSGPMRCDACGKNEAVVHFTQVVKGQVTTSHLCQACASAKGLEPQATGASTLPLADFLAKMGGPAPHPGSEEEGLTCPFCGMSAREFREAGRLGCSQCYSTFEEILRGLLRRIHGGTQHVGKVYLPPDPSAAERRKRLEALRRKLGRAIEAEDFERAAILRDQIKALEPAS